MKKQLLILVFILGCVFLLNFQALSDQSTEGGSEFRPGMVEVGFKTENISICPPGILGSNPCEYPSFIDIIASTSEFIISLAPYAFVVLLILGGFLYLLAPFDINKIQLGHKYFKWAIYGYVFLLLMSLVFSLISSILGSPNPNLVPKN